MGQGIDLLGQNNITSLKDLQQQFQKFNTVLPQDPAVEVQTNGKVIVVGDIHGDIRKFIQALLIADLIDVSQGYVQWIGGNTTLVQLGDILDRGANEISILLLIKSLDAQARLHGGAVYMLNGNHEVMNARSQFRAVTQEGFEESSRLFNINESEEDLAGQQCNARAQLFAKGGIIAKELGRNPVTLKVNDMLFAHGGVLPEHCKFGLENLNHEVGNWFKGRAVKNQSAVQKLQSALQGEGSIVWNRSYSLPCKTPGETISANENLDNILKSQDCRCLVVGHTPQKHGANTAYNGKVWRMDVGMSHGIFDLNPQVLQVDWKQGAANFQVLDWENYLNKVIPLQLGAELVKSDSFAHLHKLIKQSVQVSQTHPSMDVDNFTRKLMQSV